MINSYKNFKIILDAKAKTKSLKVIPDPDHIEAKYLSQLLEITDLMHKQTLGILSNLKQAEHFYAVDESWFEKLTSKLSSAYKRFVSNSFEKIAKSISSLFVKSVNKYNKKKSQFSIGSTPSTEDGINEYVRQAIHQNVSLIKSIPQKYFSEIEGFILNAVNRGASYKEIEEYIFNRFAVTKSRAKLIAFDQTGSINGQLTRIRQINSGYKLFKWVTQNDDRVRHQHQLIGSAETKHGRGIYSWKELPLSAKGVPIIPSQEINCRCKAKPVEKV